MIDTIYKVWVNKSMKMYDVLTMNHASSNVTVVGIKEFMITPILQNGEFELLKHIGFSDKKGVPIYENYICKYYNRIGVIQYSKTKPSFVLSCSDGEIYIHRSILKELVVLGNIYENPGIKIT